MENARRLSDSTLAYIREMSRIARWVIRQRSTNGNELQSHFFQGQKSLTARKSCQRSALAQRYVVVITSGDGFDAAAAGVTHKPVDHLGSDDFFALSRLRQAESRSALEILGGKADDPIVLGYPDGDLGNLYDSTDNKVIRQQFTKKNETYALIQKDYHTSVHGKPAPYKRSSVLGDLVELLTTLQPTEIYVTDETDGHIDHRASFWFVRDAAKQVGYKGAFYTYLVHGLPAWPFPPGVRRTGHLNRAKLTVK